LRMGAVLRYYNNLLHKYPWRTHITQTALFMGLGDFICQTTIEKIPIKEVEWKRVARFTTIGFLIMGPGLRIWYIQLDKIIPAATKYIGVKKMLVDQAVFAPAAAFAIISASGALQSKSYGQIKQALDEKLVDVILANWMMWPAVQTVNFTYVPFNYRILVVNVAAIFWNIYLAWKANT